MTGKEGETFEDGWRNKLIWGDNLLVMGSLLEKFAGKVDLIYIDPPFATGTDFSFTTEIGEADLRPSRRTDQPSRRKHIAIRGGRVLTSYSTCPRGLALIRDLLPTGDSLYFHVD